MNREECLDWLYRLRSEIYVYMPKEWIIPMNNALDMVIKELEQEPSYNSVKTELDLISRQAVIDSLHSKFADGFDSDRWWNSMSVLYAINKVPSVSTETTNRCEDAVSRELVKKDIARWIGYIDEDMIARMHITINKLPSVSVAEKVEIGHWSRKTKVDAYDLCGVKTWGIKCQCDRCTFTTTVVEDFGYYRYCPNCGARMFEPQESEVQDADCD